MNQGKRYADSFKAEAVALVLNSRRTQKEIAEDMGLSSRTLRRWIRERERYGPRWIARKHDHQLQLRAKTREIKELRRELKLMGEANRFFSRETR